MQSLKAEVEYNRTKNALGMEQTYHPETGGYSVRPVNIDGNCNRVAASMFGPKRVYYVVGINKIAPDFEKALWRARNVAAPKNAQRLGKKTPCAVKADRCYDCKSPERICRGLSVLWRKPTGFEQAEVVLIGEELGM